MGQGQTAYLSYVRIHEEMGAKTPPEWNSLPHLRRMAWEAAAQAVAMQVLPEMFRSEPEEDSLENGLEAPEAVEVITDQYIGDKIGIQE